MFLEINYKWQAKIHLPVTSIREIVHIAVSSQKPNNTNEANSELATHILKTVSEL